MQTPITLINVNSQAGAGTPVSQAAPQRLTYLINHLMGTGYRLTPPMTIEQHPDAVEGDTRCRYLDAVQAVNTQVRFAVMLALTSGYRPVVIGGDHSVAIASAEATAEYLFTKRRTPGLVWADAHIDMNTPDTSPSGNIHGMALAALCGLVPAIRTVATPAVVVPPDSISVVGLRFTDVEERPNIAAAGLVPVSMSEITAQGVEHYISQTLDPLLATAEGIHLSFDLDVLDPSIAPAVNTPEPGGITLLQAQEICTRVAEAGKLVTMDMVEHNPEMGHDDLMLPLMAEILSAALGAPATP